MGTTVATKATDATGAATSQQPKTTEERVVQLEAELLALSKENNLLTDTMKNNWNAFKTSCGAVLTSKCADIAKESEDFVEEFESRKKHHRDDEHHKRKHGEHERKLRGGRHRDDDDDDDDHRHHRHKKGHGGKHGPEPPVARSIHCVLKQSSADVKSVPAHCVRSAKRFDIYLKINRPSKVVVMMPPRRHVSVWGILFPLLLLCAIFGCCFKCVRRMRRSKCPVHLQQEQPVQQAQIVLGQPVVLTNTTESAKI